MKKHKRVFGAIMALIAALLAILLMRGCPSKEKF
jgi:hypothetical protein